MHDNTTPSRRYGRCPHCWHPLGWDTVIKACTITSCAEYFGTKPAPVPPRTREIVEAERAVLAGARVWLKTGVYSAQLAALVAKLVDLDP